MKIRHVGCASSPLALRAKSRTGTLRFARHERPHPFANLAGCWSPDLVKTESRLTGALLVKM
uniref:hypothetical protein n=1 Tax=Corallococcus coralloides TaxID=184914 RepID=UPI000FFEFC33|nr:hypothetical protein [Corallococcus coralloides]